MKWEYHKNKKQNAYSKINKKNLEKIILPLWLNWSVVVWGVQWYLLIFLDCCLIFIGNLSLELHIWICKSKLSYCNIFSQNIAQSLRFYDIGFTNSEFQTRNLTTYFSTFEQIIVSIQNQICQFGIGETVWLVVNTSFWNLKGRYKF